MNAKLPILLLIIIAACPPAAAPAGVCQVVAGVEAIERTRGYLLLLRDQVAGQVCQGRDLKTTLAQLATVHEEDYGRPFRVGVPGREKFARDDKAFAEHVAAAWKHLSAAPADPPPDGPPCALVLLGDHYHPPGYIRPPLEAALKAAGLAGRFLYNPAHLSAGLLKGHRLLVVLRDGLTWPDPASDRPTWWMTDRQQQAVIDFVRAGGGLLALHNANALRPWDDKAGPAAILRLIGSQYDGHGSSNERFAVAVLDGRHPITRGVAGFEVVGERHRPRLLGEGNTPLLKASSGGETSVAAYVRTEGKGRVFYLALGHNRKALEAPAVQRLLVNGARWCGRLTGAAAGPGRSDGSH